MEPQKFTKKPVTIEAMQWDGTAEGATPIINWILDNDGNAYYSCLQDTSSFTCNGKPEKHVIDIYTLEGVMEATRNDWIIRGIQGEFYPCKPDIFEETYDAAD